MLGVGIGDVLVVSLIEIVIELFVYIFLYGIKFWLKFVRIVNFCIVNDNKCVYIKSRINKVVSWLYMYIYLMFYIDKKYRINFLLIYIFVLNIFIF